MGETTTGVGGSKESEKMPSGAEPHAVRIDQALAARRWRLAVDACSEAAEGHPDWARPRLARAAVYAKLGMWDEVEEDGEIDAMKTG